MIPVVGTTFCIKCWAGQLFIMIHGFVLDLKINITVCGADEIASLVSRHELASRTFFECPFLRDYVSIVSSSLF